MRGRTAISTRVAAHLRANVIGYAALLCAVALVPAWASAGDSSDRPKAAASANVTKQVKKLKRRLASVEGQLATLQAQSGSPRVPTGAAGGDLTGSYPNPLIGPDAVGSAEIATNAVASDELAGRIDALSIGTTSGVLTGVGLGTNGFGLLDDGVIVASISPDASILAGDLNLFTGGIKLAEVADIGGIDNQGRLYVRDNVGVTELVVQWDDSIDVLAAEATGG